MKDYLKLVVEVAVRLTCIPFQGLAMIVGCLVGVLYDSFIEGIKESRKFFHPGPDPQTNTDGPLQGGNR